jgi:hypothetical protein
LAYSSGDSHPNGTGARKIANEFAPLLNLWYGQYEDFYDSLGYVGALDSTISITSNFEADYDGPIVYTGSLDSTIAVTAASVEGRYFVAGEMAAQIAITSNFGGAYSVAGEIDSTLVVSGAFEADYEGPPTYTGSITASLTILSDYSGTFTPTYTGELESELSIQSEYTTNFMPIAGGEAAMNIFVLGSFGAGYTPPITITGVPGRVWANRRITISGVTFGAEKSTGKVEASVTGEDTWVEADEYISWSNTAISVIITTDGDGYVLGSKYDLRVTNADSEADTLDEAFAYTNPQSSGTKDGAYNRPSFRPDSFQRGAYR